MKVKTKVSILIISVFSALVVFFVAYQYVRQQEFNLYLKSKLASDQLVIDKVLEFKAKSYLQPTIDNAVWDEAVDFMKTKDTVWAGENFAISIVTFDMTFFKVYELDGTLIYSAAPQGAPELILPKNEVVKWFSKEKAIHTFLFSNGQLFEIFGSAIVPSYDIDYQTKEKGYLISVKLWDSIYIGEIEDATGFKLKILEKNNKNDVTDTENSEVILHTVINAEGSEAIILDFHRKNQLLFDLDAFKYLTIAGFLILLVFIAIFFYFINRWLTKPLNQLTTSLKDNDPGPVRHLLSKKNEFGVLANLIRQFNDQKNELIKEVRQRTEATEKYKALLAAQPDIMFLTDMSGLIIDYYAPDTKWLPESSNDWAGRNVDEILSQHLMKRFQSRIDKYKTSKIVLPLEFDQQLQDGTHTYEARIVINDQNHVLSIIREITDRKRAEKALKINESRLRELNATKDKFFSIIAHDLKSPFNNILGFSELLKDEAHELNIDSIIQYAGFINSSTQHTYDLLENLLKWARVQQGMIPYEPTSILLSQLVDTEIQGVMINAIQKNIDLIEVIQENLSIKADINMLSIVLRNLITNAIKFTPKNGKVKVVAKVLETQVEVSISDTGIGMTHKAIQNLFKIETSFSTRGTENEMGTGLGLLLCKEFISKHGGKIWVDSEVGKGSTFSFSIPRFDPPIIG